MGIAADRAPPRWKRDHEAEAAGTPNPSPEAAGARMLGSDWPEEAKGGGADGEGKGRGTLVRGRRSGGRRFKWGWMGAKAGGRPLRALSDGW